MTKSIIEIKNLLIIFFGETAKFFLKQINLTENDGDYHEELFSKLKSRIMEISADWFWMLTEIFRWKKFTFASVDYVTYVVRFLERNLLVLKQIIKNLDCSDDSCRKYKYTRMSKQLFDFRISDSIAIQEYVCNHPILIDCSVLMRQMFLKKCTQIHRKNRQLNKYSLMNKFFGYWHVFEGGRTDICVLIFSCPKILSNRNLTLAT